LYLIDDEETEFFT